jgi:glycosyltransferase involved in cell wall biosynthesis
MKKKNVISIVLNNFKHDARVLKETKSLQNNGFKVTLVALHEEPLAEREKIENIHVHRIKLITRGWPKYRLIQFIKYVEFLYRAIKEYKRADIYHCNDLNALPVGVFIKMFLNKKAKVVYDAHEYETERNGTRRLEKPFLRMLESFLIKRADKVITVSASIALEYVRLYNIPKPALVLNCPAFTEVSPQDIIFRQTFGIRQDQTIFLYQGGLSNGRGIEMLIQAFSGLESDKNVIVFMGYGVLEGQIKEVAEKYPNIFFHQAISPDVLLNYTASADFGVSCIEDSCLSYRYCLPNKIFEYFMVGIPVVASNLFEMKRLVEKHGLGVVAAENTAKGFRDAVSRIHSMDYDQLVGNVASARKIFNWENQEKALLKVYSEL